MNVGSVSSSYNPYSAQSTQSTQSTQAAQRQPEATEVNRGRDRDGDSDDRSGATQASQGPSVNTSGQVVGGRINTTA